MSLMTRFPTFATAILGARGLSCSGLQVHKDFSPFLSCMNDSLPPAMQLLLRLLLLPALPSKTIKYVNINRYKVLLHTKASTGKKFPSFDKSVNTRSTISKVQTKFLAEKNNKIKEKETWKKAAVNLKMQASCSKHAAY